MGQFKALLTKNWILTKRSPVGCVLEIIIPILFMVFILMIRQLAKITTYEDTSYLGNTNYTFTMYGNPSSAISDMSISPPTTFLKYFSILT